MTKIPFESSNPSMACGPFSQRSHLPTITTPSQRQPTPLTPPSLAPTRPSGPSATIHSTSQRWSSHHRHIRRETAPGGSVCCHRIALAANKGHDADAAELSRAARRAALHARGHGGPGPVGELLLSSVQSLNRSSTVTANQSSTPSCSLGDICS